MLASSGGYCVLFCFGNVASGRSVAGSDLRVFWHSALPSGSLSCQLGTEGAAESHPSYPACGCASCVEYWRSLLFALVLNFHSLPVGTQSDSSNLVARYFDFACAAGSPPSAASDNCYTSVAFYPLKQSLSSFDLDFLRFCRVFACCCFTLPLLVKMAAETPKSMALRF